MKSHRKEVEREWKSIEKKGRKGGKVQKGSGGRVKRHRKEVDEG